MSRADYRSRPNSRPQSASDQLVELHVYLVPEEIWRVHFNNLPNQDVTQTISLGIIRIDPNQRLKDLREEISAQLPGELPQDYVFLRSVGRCLTRLRSKQEFTLKAKHFVPPRAYAAELFLLEASIDTRTSLASDNEYSSQASFRNSADSPRSTNPAYSSFRDRDRGSKTYRNDHRDKDRDIHNDRYNKTGPSRTSYMSQTPRRGQAGAADLQTENSSRMQRDHARDSPSKRFTPIAKLDPSSPTGSRNASPVRTARNDLQYHSNSRSPDRKYDSDRRYDDRRQDEKDDRRQDEKYDDRYDRNSDEKEDPRKQDDDDHRFNDERNLNDHKFDKDSRNYHDQYERNHESPNRPIEPSEAGVTYRKVSPDPDSSMNGYPILPPINDTPPRSAERGPGKRGENKDPRSATYTTNTNTDSGIADSGVSPEDQYHRRRENYEDELARKRRELANEKFDLYDDDSYRIEDMEERDRIDQKRWEEDREYRRQWIEDERRRREEEEERKKRQEAGEDDEDDRKIKRSESEEELARYPSPPELEMGSPRETESAKRRTREEKEHLMKELEAAREKRKNTEKEREELVKKAKQLQNKTQNRRNHARDIWKKRYFEEKKKTAPLEEQTNRLRNELDNIHRKLMSTLEGPKEKNIRLSGDAKPSLKNNYVIQCTRLQHEIEDLRRRVENAKMKLTAEMKLRNQAQAELRALRAELTQKKINLTLTRNQHLAALNPAGDIPMNQAQPIAPQS